MASHMSEDVKSEVEFEAERSKRRGKRIRSYTEPSLPTKSVSFNLEENSCLVYTPPRGTKRGRRRQRTLFEGTGWDVQGYLEKQALDSSSDGQQSRADDGAGPVVSTGSEHDEPVSGDAGSAEENSPATQGAREAGAADPPGTQPAAKAKKKKKKKKKITNQQVEGQLPGAEVEGSEHQVIAPLDSFLGDTISVDAASEASTEDTEVSVYPTVSEPIDQDANCTEPYLETTSFSAEVAEDAESIGKKKKKAKKKKRKKKAATNEIMQVEETVPRHCYVDGTKFGKVYMTVFLEGFSGVHMRISAAKCSCLIEVQDDNDATVLQPRAAAATWKIPLPHGVVDLETTNLCSSVGTLSFMLEKTDPYMNWRQPDPRTVRNSPTSLDLDETGGILEDFSAFKRKAECLVAKPIAPGIVQHGSSNPPAAMKTITRKDIRHDGYQSETAVTLCLYVKNAINCDVVVEDGTRCCVSFELQNTAAGTPEETAHQKHKWCIELAEKVHAACTSKVRAAKIELKFTKLKVSLWPTLLKNSTDTITGAVCDMPNDNVGTNDNSPIEKLMKDPTAPSTDTAQRVTESQQNEKQDDYEDVEEMAVARSVFKNIVTSRGIPPGLRNIGNTCFLNCILQCLANTRPLCNTFLSGAFELDLNVDNPLGSGGKIATEFARFMNQYWLSTDRVLVPLALKKLVGDKNESFRGFQQQDAEESMTYLMDYLHEDLNRIKKKPYIEDGDSEGRPDNEVADEAWSNYHKRNDSVVSDVFQGQLRSQMTCPECGFAPVKFDSFSTISLPLPQKTVRHEVLFIPYCRNPDSYGHQYPVTKYAVRVNVASHTTVFALVSKLSILCGVPQSHLILQGTDKNTGKLIQINDWGVPLVTLGRLSQVVAVQGSQTERLSYVSVRPRKEKVCSLKACSGCGKLAKESQTLKRCSRCLSVCYCSGKCQADHWGSHKGECKQVKAKLQQQQDEGGDAGPPLFVGIPTDKHSYSSVLSTLVSAFNRVVVPGVLSNKNCRLVHLDLAGNRLSHEEINLGVNKTLNLECVKCLGLVYQELYDENSTLKYRSIPEHSSVAETANYDDSDELSPSLDGAFRLFSESEKLEASEAWYCSKCETHQEAIKKLSLWRTSRVLVVHLKRFSFRNVLWKDKLSFLVDFPLEGLDISKYVALGAAGSAAMVYDLYGVANHHGNMIGGHYTAYCKSAEDDKWYFFNDDEVSETTPERVASSSDAYILFYRLRETANSASGADGQAK